MFDHTVQSHNVSLQSCAANRLLRYAFGWTVLKLNEAAVDVYAQISSSVNSLDVQTRKHHTPKTCCLYHGYESIICRPIAAVLSWSFWTAV